MAGALLIRAPVRPFPRTLTSARGITLVDMLVVVTIVGIIAAMALPVFRDLTATLRLGAAARAVERELQGARLKAVTAGRPVRVRFNCPVNGQFRAVELLGTTSSPTAADTASSRCQTTGNPSYPHPAPDNDPLTVPNNDGPLQQLPTGVTFNASRTIEFRPDGSAHADDGTGKNPWPVLPDTGVSIVLQQDTRLRTITVNGLGKIQLVP